MGWNQLKMNWEWTFVYLPFIWTTLLKSKLMSERTSRKLFYFFCIKVKSIYKLRYIVFPNLQHPSLFYKNLPSAADKFTHSVVFTNTYTYTTLFSVSSLDIIWSTLLKSYFVWNICFFFVSAVESTFFIRITS